MSYQISQIAKRVLCRLVRDVLIYLLGQSPNCASNRRRERERRRMERKGKAKNSTLGNFDIHEIAPLVGFFRLSGDDF